MHIANDPKILIKLIGERPVRLALGNFDGVHQGHRKLIRGLVDRATHGDEASIVVTFVPHPAQYFGRNGGIKKIDTPLIQRRCLRDLSVTGILELNFNAELASMSGEDFIDKILCGFNLLEIAVGSDFRFGRNRCGGVDLLKAEGLRRGFSITVMETVEIEGVVASSSRVRTLLSEQGDVAMAAKVLGRPFSLIGRVQKGDQIGRQLGFPTANLSDIHQVIPKTGVYSGTLKVLRELSSELVAEEPMPCVVNIGVRPTVDAGNHTQVEAHVYDNECSTANLDLYGETVEIQFLKRLRDEQKFENIEALKRQISKDIDAARD